MHLRSTSMMMALLLVVSATGCKSTRLSHDGNEVRGALLQLYEDQAMDNLIRARRNQPVVHLDFDGINVQESDSLSANYGGSQNSTQPLAGAARAVATGWNLGTSASNSATLSYDAKPVNNDTGIYDLYRDFADRPDFLCEGTELPDWDVHIYREKDGCFYWIACDQSRTFYEFMMATTFDRRKDPAYHGFYDVGISEIPQVDEQKDGRITAIIKFDQPVPKGTSSAIVTLADGREVRLNLEDVTLSSVKEKDLKDEIFRDSKTSRISYKDAMWNTSSLFTSLNLEGRRARVYSAKSPPPMPADRVEELLEKSARSLKRLQINQINGN